MFVQPHKYVEGELVMVKIVAEIGGLNSGFVFAPYIPLGSVQRSPLQWVPAIYMSEDVFNDRDSGLNNYRVLVDGRMRTIREECINDLDKFKRRFP